MQYVTVVNRTNEVLEGTWDGKHYDIPPGKSEYPEIAAIAFKRQNPVRGTSDPRYATNMDLIVGSSQYKLGIVEHGDPCDSLVTTNNEPNEPIERWDRSKLAGALPTEIRPGDNGLYAAPRRTIGSEPLSPNVGFTNPD